MQAYRNWDELKAACLECHACGLAETRHNIVFGAGDQNTDIMFVGEGPGQREDLTGVPFVGRAGQLLDNYLESVGISRDQIYIANVVKCRPPGNRDPEKTEQAACLLWLRGQTALIKPKIIVCLGRIAAKALIKPSFAITKEHGIWFQKGNVRMMATYHPSALLRDISKRGDAFDDFVKIAEAWNGLYGRERP